MNGSLEDSINVGMMGHSCNEECLFLHIERNGARDG